jgi:hypothetical protein
MGQKIAAYMLAFCRLNQASRPGGWVNMAVLKDMSPDLEF